MENQEIYKNLVMLLKMFKNRPYHLAKYLIENSALTDDFLKKLKDNENLKKFNENEPKMISTISVYFVDISQMEDFYNSFIDVASNEKNMEEITKDINSKLNELIRQEKYEEAARVRDYMTKNYIKRIY